MTKIRVILADDHSVLLDGLRFLLEAHSDIQVVGVATDGRQAVDLGKKFLPDVIVMDIAMPELSGIEALQILRQDCPNVKVVILSMYATQVHIHRALQSGALGYLLKENAGQEVVNAVRSAAAGKRYLSQRVNDLIVEEYIQVAAPRDPLDLLNLRERDILRLVVDGKTSAEIAQILFLSPKTIDTYRSRLMGKLGVEDLPGLVKFAIQKGIISVE